MASCLLIRNIDLYDPNHAGLTDLLAVNGSVVRVAPGIRPDCLGVDVEVIDAGGRQAVPGYVDQHVHVIGGGGESGPYSRPPELQLGSVVSAGVTTLVGVLGTDGTSRSSEALLAKVRGAGDRDSRQAFSPHPHGPQQGAHRSGRGADSPGRLYRLYRRL